MLVKYALVLVLYMNTVSPSDRTVTHRGLQQQDQNTTFFAAIQQYHRPKPGGRDDQIIIKIGQHAVGDIR